MVQFVAGLLVLAAQASLGLAACPNITLPWGIYQSSKSVNNGATCVYNNVRFGKKPVRFQRPDAPDSVSTPTLQPTKASACYQYQPKRDCPTTSAVAGLDSAPITVKQEPPRFGGPLPGDSDEDGMSEDCLFADLYVPASAISKPNAKLPVVVWLYGGAFIFGSKDYGATPFYEMPFYYGTGLMSHGQDFIFVAGNYRLGSFGWLAGPTMVEKGTANAGLWDQRLLLDFVQKHISVFGGDSDHVSLWGESAGAGSILHHLTSSPPTPKIKTALVQSPAYLWQWNPTNKGYAAQIYETLVKTCDCGSDADPFVCLQNLPVRKLQDCNKKIISTVWQQTGLAPFNPAIDGDLIKDLPTVSLYNGKIAPLDSLLVSHVYDESKNFVPCWINSTSTFKLFLNEFMPGDLYAPQRAEIEKKYPEASYSGKKGPHNRAHDVIQDSSFTCNTRFVYDAYTKASKPTYMMHYAFGAALGFAVHAADLLPTFWNSDLSYDTFFKFANATIDPGIYKITATLAYNTFGVLAKAFQPYLATFATGGRPIAVKGAPEWKVAKPDASGSLTNVLDLTMTVDSITHGSPDWDNKFVDPQNSDAVCAFWKNMSFWVEATARGSNRPTLVIQDGDKLELK